MNIKIYDNPEYMDRYSVIYLDHVNRGQVSGIGMNAHPTHPQGIGMHFELPVSNDYSHLGKEIQFSDLPEDCQTVVKRDLN